MQAVVRLGASWGAGVCRICTISARTVPRTFDAFCVISGSNMERNNGGQGTRDTEYGVAGFPVVDGALGTRSSAKA